MQATWTRGAGSHTGVCVLNLQSFGEFNHTFEMLEYRGAMAYTPGSTTVSGALAAAKSGQPDELLGGPLTFQKSTVDLLTLQSGSLTNAAAQPLPFFSQQYGRDSGWPTNYYGWFEFADYDLSTAEDDFYWWVLSIDDTNDSDGDGIPDFSDEPSAGRRAELSLGKGTSGLTLSIAADVGTTWRVEKSTSLSGGWTLETTVTISTDPQPVLLPEPSTPTFWRAVKQ